MDAVAELVTQKGGGTLGIPSAILWPGTFREEQVPIGEPLSAADLADPLRRYLEQRTRVVESLTELMVGLQPVIRTISSPSKMDDTSIPSTPAAVFEAMVGVLRALTEVPPTSGPAFLVGQPPLPDGAARFARQNP
jgi:hypothetical protein